MMTGQKEKITTCVLHHPLRPIKCLIRALKSLNNASILQHKVEVIVQGPLQDGVSLPNSSNFSNIELIYFHNKENLGSAVPLVHSIERFLETDHAWWAKCDDDMSFDEGGWDIVIKTLNNEDNIGEYNCGCSMLAVPILMWAAKPRNFYTKQHPSKKDIKLLQWNERGYVSRRINDGITYTVCDFADHGCTVFKREIFEAGCIPDSYFFTGGIDFDLCWQMLQKGFKSILVTNPRSMHHHGECKPWKYGVIRYDPEQTNKSGQYFKKKWGLEIQFLTNFKGLPQYMPAKKTKMEVVVNMAEDKVTAIKKRPTGINWHRKAVKGQELWTDGLKHLEFLIANGLEKNHRVLDTGCGSLRTGIHLIKYLNRGLYFGIDKEALLIEAANKYEILPHQEMIDKEPFISIVANFDISKLAVGLRFHFIWAYSLFTHLSPEEIEMCLSKLMPRLTQHPKGKFFASFNLSNKIEIGGKHIWRDEIAVTRYPLEVFEDIADKLGINVNHVSPAIVDTYKDFPNKQRILKFTNRF